MTVATIIYPELSGEQYPAGIQFESPEGTQRRAVYSVNQQSAGMVAVEWHLQTLVETLDGTAVWVEAGEQTPPLIVTNASYRRLSDGAVAPASEATADGMVKPGYISEYGFFRLLFGLDNSQPKGIFWFICDAMCIKLNQMYPTLNLMLA